MRSLFITFGDGSADFKLAAVRLAEQAASLRLFDSVVSLNHEELMAASSRYADDYDSITKLDTYPFHFRAAKTWVIQAALAGCFGEFDVICYSDAGCEISSNRVTREIVKRQLEFTMREGGLAEQIPFIENCFTKRKVLEYLDVPDSAAQSGQIQPGWIMIRNDVANIALVERWRELSDSELDLWQNPTNPALEESYFRGHRRDQSLFSLLWKAQGLPVKPVNAEWTCRFGTLRSFCVPIHTRRNRTGQVLISPLSNSSVLAFLGLAINLAVRIVKAKPNTFVGGRVPSLRN